MALANGMEDMSELTPEIDMTHTWSARVWDWPLQHNDGVVNVVNKDGKFEVGLDVQFFTPKEIEIKVCGNELVIHCRHEYQDSLGRVAREIHRAYKLPEEIDGKSIKSHLNSKGVLLITATQKT